MPTISKAIIKKTTVNPPKRHKNLDDSASKESIRTKSQGTMYRVSWQKNRENAM